MAARRAPRQTPLDLYDAGDGRRYRPGVVERAVTVDIRTLRELELLPPGADALAAALRLCAREVDRAEREHDRWGKLGAARELRQLRAQLGALAPLPPAGEDIDDVVERLAAAVRDHPPL